MNSEKYKESLKQWMFALLMVLLVLPMIQARYGIFSEKPLFGAFTTPDTPDLKAFKRTDWLNGTFQEKFNTQIENNIGFRNFLVRVNNQVDYTFFNQANAEGVISGKNRQLFEKDYIREYFGEYFIGDSTWKMKARQLKLVQDTLKSLGKTFAVIIEPDKANFFSDQLPRKYRNTPENQSNYQRLLHHFSEAGINLLDLNAFFIQEKGNHEHPLFPRTGTHWSYYGAAIAADTTLEFLEKISQRPLNQMDIRGVKVLDTIRHPDADIALAMNTLFPLRQKPSANPVYSYKDSRYPKPKAIVAGDSFYFNWLNDGIPSSVFESCDFWYYNNRITRADYSEGGLASDKNFMEEILNQDFVIIMITGRFLHAFAWGFDENLFETFFPEQANPIAKFADAIRRYDGSFIQLLNDNENPGLTLEEKIWQHAGFLFYDDYKKNPGKYTKLSDLTILMEMAIRGTPEWVESLKEKAVKNSISLDEQIKMDAAWMANEKVKELNTSR